MTATIPKDIIRIGQVEVQFIASTDALSMFEFHVPAGARVPAAHYHVEVEEVVYGLEGILTMTVDGQAYELKAGESLVVPKGVEHHFDNRHEGLARGLTVQTPGAIKPAFYREIGEIVNAGGAPNPAMIKETMGRHGLVAVAPRA